MGFHVSGLPSIGDTWTRSGWVVQSRHAPGSYRMLALWGAAFAQIPFTINLLHGSAGIQAAMLVALLASVTLVAAGIWLYLHLSAAMNPVDEPRTNGKPAMAQPGPRIPLPPSSPVYLISTPASRALAKTGLLALEPPTRAAAWQNHNLIDTEEVQA